ncbi:hypothetical protein [Mesorhizobium sp. BAC0120]|uniref:hypothetical protein n=1 Tax=Mesorhizobium sp. BAC0120 TaxID=3090670 RepID=UPI00298C2CA7|nr:hypothetical protein [Mesorhizobium sp. BAC0120]
MIVIAAPCQFNIAVVAALEKNHTVGKDLPAAEAEPAAFGGHEPDAPAAGGCRTGTAMTRNRSRVDS